MPSKSAKKKSITIKSSNKKPQKKALSGIFTSTPISNQRKLKINPQRKPNDKVNIVQKGNKVEKTKK